MRPGDMNAQAAWFVSHAKPGANTLLAADYEDESLTLNDLMAFLYAVEKHSGIQPVIYGGGMLKQQLGNSQSILLAQYRLWLAEYTTGTPTWPVNTWPKWWLWQFSNKGSVDGVVGDCDVDAFDGTVKELKTQWSGAKQHGPSDVTMAISGWPAGVGLRITVNDEEWFPHAHG